MNKFKKFVYIILAALALSSCSRDVSHDPQYLSDYVIGATYRLKERIYGKINEPSLFGAKKPILLDIYEPGSKGVVEPGTLVKITKLELENNIEMGKTIWVHGKASGIAWAPDSNVELWFISIKKKDQKSQVDIPMINSEYLELISKP